MTGHSSTTMASYIPLATIPRFSIAEDDATRLRRENAELQRRLAEAQAMLAQPLGSVPATGKPQRDFTRALAAWDDGGARFGVSRFPFRVG